MHLKFYLFDLKVGRPSCLFVLLQDESVCEGPCVAVSEGNLSGYCPAKCAPTENNVICKCAKVNQSNTKSLDPFSIFLLFVFIQSLKFGCIVSSMKGNRLNIICIQEDFIQDCEIKKN